MGHVLRSRPEVSIGREKRAKGNGMGGFGTSVADGSRNFMTDRSGNL